MAWNKTLLALVMVGGITVVVKSAPPPDEWSPDRPRERGHKPLIDTHMEQLEARMAGLSAAQRENPRLKDVLAFYAQPLAWLKSAQQDECTQHALGVDGSAASLFKSLEFDKEIEKKLEHARELILQGMAVEGHILRSTPVCKVFSEIKTCFDVYTAVRRLLEEMKPIYTGLNICLAAKFARPVAMERLRNLEALGAAHLLELESFIRSQRLCQVPANPASADLLARVKGFQCATQSLREAKVRAHRLVKASRYMCMSDGVVRWLVKNNAPLGYEKDLSLWEAYADAWKEIYCLPLFGAEVSESAYEAGMLRVAQAEKAICGESSIVLPMVARRYIRKQARLAV